MHGFAAKLLRSLQTSLLMEQLNYNLMYRWFVGLSPDDPVWDPTTFTKNRDRLQNGEVFAKFMTKLLNHPQVKPLLSDEHFSVDGTLIEAWASHKSFRPKDGSGDEDGGANFHGQQRKNDTHASTSDPDSRLYRKAAGREAKLCYMGHTTMERLQPDPHSQIADGLADSAHNHPVAPRVRRQKDKKSATLHVLQRTASAVQPTIIRVRLSIKSIMGLTPTSVSAPPARAYEKHNPSFMVPGACRLR